MDSWVKKELGKLKIYRSKKLLLLPATTTRIDLAPVTSSSTIIPHLADQEVVLAADLGCAGCYKRAADAISTIDGFADLESVVVHVVEKKVTISCKSVTNKSSSAKSSVLHNIQAKQASKPSS